MLKLFGGYAGIVDRRKTREQCDALMVGELGACSLASPELAHKSGDPLIC